MRKIHASSTFTVLVASLLFAWAPCANAQTVLTDDFNDGVLGPEWRPSIVPLDFNEFNFDESGGTLNVHWPQLNFARLRFIHTLRAQGRVLTVSADMAKQSAGVNVSNSGVAGIAIVDESQLFGLIKRGADWARAQGSIVGFGTTTLNLDPVGAPQGVNPALHRLSLSYDTVNQEISYFADGQELCPGAQVPPCPEARALGDKLLVALWVDPSNDVGIDVVFDNFEATFAPMPPDVFPVSNATLGTVTEAISTAEDVFFPAWAPDSSQVAFLRRDSVCSAAVAPCSDGWDLQTVDVPIGMPPVIKTIATAAEGTFVTFGSYSEDGTRVFFNIRAGAARAAEVDSAFITTAPVYPPNPSLVQFPVHRGNHLYFRNFTFGAVQVWRIPADVNGTPLTAPLPGGVPTANLIGDSTLLIAIPERDTGFGDVSADESMLVATANGLSGDLDVHMYSGLDAILKVPTADPATQPITSRTDPRVTAVSTGPGDAVGGTFSLDQTKIYFTEAQAGTLCASCLISANAGFTNAELFGDHNWEIMVFDTTAPLNPPEIIDPSLTTSEAGLRVSPDGTLLVLFRAENALGGPLGLDGDGNPDFDLYLANIVEEEAVPAATGGTVTDGSGSTLDVSAGALTTDTTITMTTPFPGTEPDTSSLVGVTSLALARDFGPDGTTFDPPATLTLHYTHEQVAGFNEATLQIYIFDSFVSAWTALPTTVDVAANTATAMVDHFTTFGLIHAPGVEAVAKLKPDKIRLAKPKKHIKVEIRVPLPATAFDIDPDTLLFNDVVVPISGTVRVSEKDDGSTVLRVKFPGDAVAATLDPGMISQDVTITGDLVPQGQAFTATTQIHLKVKHD